MISPFAFKMAMVHMLPYLFLLTSKDINFTSDTTFLTSSYSSIAGVSSVRRIKVDLGDWKLETKLIGNATHSFILVDLPYMVKLCRILSLHAPKLSCQDQTTINSRELVDKLDTTLIRRSFGSPTFEYGSKTEFIKLVMSGTYDYAFMVQTFPSLAIRLKQPITITEGNDCGAQECSEPRIADFFLDGTRDTAITLAAEMTVRYVVQPYVMPYVRPGLVYLGRPFIKWYNKALYGSGTVSARAFEAGVAASSENIAMSSVTSALRAPAGTFESEVAPFIAHLDRNGASFRTISGSSITHFKSPLSSIPSVSATSGSLRGVLASTKSMGTEGLVRHVGDLRYMSSPTIPSLGTTARTLNIMSTNTVELVATASATNAAAPVYRSASRRVLMGMAKAMRWVPKRRRRELDPTCMVVNVTYFDNGLDNVHTEEEWCPPARPRPIRSPKRASQVVAATSTTPEPSTPKSADLVNATSDTTQKLSNSTNDPARVWSSDDQDCGKYAASRQRVRCRRQISRGVALTLRATARLASKVPSWAWKATTYSVPWIASGVVHLTTFDTTITTIHPIQTLASFERFYIAASTLMFCQCFHDNTITQRIDKEATEKIELIVSGRTFRNSDVVYNLDLALPGDTLKQCHAFFDTQTVGLDRDLLLEILSVHFDITYVIGGVLFYNGPAKFIINDYRTYFRDVYPLFSPTIKSPDPVGNMEAVASYDNNFRTARAARVKRKSYTATQRDTTNRPSITLNSESSYTNSVEHLLNTPRLRYEFDIITSSHYNSSFLYYKDLRHYTDSQSIDFGQSTSHSSFKILHGITIIEVMRNINPFDLYIPRMNLIRELIGGYDAVGEIKRLRDAATDAHVHLEYAPLRTIIGLMWLTHHPADQTGFNALAYDGTNITEIVANNVFTLLYRDRYARIPLLLVLKDKNDVDILVDMFAVHIRQTGSIESWQRYSPIVITTRISLIPSGAYSLCISQKQQTTELPETVFGTPMMESDQDALFNDACDLAALHVTYDKNLQELLENEYMPDRLKSLMTTTAKETTYALPSGGAYDPILSEVINVIEPSHEEELTHAINHPRDEGRLKKSNVRSPTSLPIGAFTSPEITLSAALTNSTTFMERNAWLLIAGAVMFLLLIAACTAYCRTHIRRHVPDTRDEPMHQMSPRSRMLT